MTELKPCPFCGAIPEVETSDWKYGLEPADISVMIITQRVKIHCPNCFITMDIAGEAHADRCMTKKEYKVLAKHLATTIIKNFWNKRV